MIKVEPLSHTGGKIAAAHDHVLVLRPVAATTSKGGLIIPDKAKKPYHYGFAFAVGPKVETVAAGDYVIFAPESARDVFFDNPNKTMFTVVCEAGIYARLSLEQAKELDLEMPQTDLADVLGRTAATAVPVPV